MGLELTVLGSGNYAPGRGKTVRNPAGYALRAEDSLILLDVGFGNVRQLARAGLRPEDVTDVFLSHVHPDHCGDLPALLFQLRYDAKPARGRLRLWGPAGTRELVAGLCKIWKPWLDPREYALEVRELEGGSEVQGVGWVAEAARARHTVSALSFRISCGSSSLVYTGDTEYHEALARFAKDCDLLLVECTVDEDDKTPGHMCPREALELVRRSNCRRALLTHLSDASAAAAAPLLAKEPRAALAKDLLRRRI